MYRFLAAAVLMTIASAAGNLQGSAEWPFAAACEPPIPLFDTPIMGAVFDGSVQMIVDSTVIHLDLLTVRRRVEIDPAAGSALAADLAQRYSHCVRTIALHAFGSVLQRVAFDLLDQASRTQLSAGQLEAAVLQQEIADGIGSARPVVAKGLTAIRARRLVDTAHRRVRIIDPAGLEALALSGLL